MLKKYLQNNNQYNIISFVYLITLSTIILFASCIKEEFDKPSINIPRVDFESNTSIEELKSQYNNDLDSISEDIIIQGIITANDESGNIYKTLYIRDNTGGLEIKIDKNSMYNEYRLGQKILIKCQGLYMGKYGGMQQLGYNYNNSIGRIPDVLIPNHIFKDSLPGDAPTPITTTIGSINSSLFGNLIKIENVSFENAGLTFAEESTTNRNLVDMSDNVILVRTSNYADFAQNIIPEGTGTVIGILSVFNQDLQLYIRDLDDLTGFDETSSIKATLFSDNFDSQVSSNWTIFSVSSNKNWQYNSSDKCMEVNGYNADEASNDYLITKAIDLSNVNTPILKFKTWTKYTDTGTDNPITVLISTDYSGSGDPTSATWTNLDANFPEYHSQTWTNSGDIDLTSYLEQTIYIAFKYISTGTGSSANSHWKLDEVSVKAIENE